MVVAMRPARTERPAPIEIGPRHRSRPMTRAASAVTWAYAAAFGIPTFYVANHLDDNGFLPSFRGSFEMYAGPWSGRYDDRTFIQLLIAFSLVLVVASIFAAMVWRGSGRGVVLALAWLPVEAVFWYGFALPFPWLIGIVRTALLVASWRSTSRVTSAG